MDPLILPIKTRADDGVEKLIGELEKIRKLTETPLTLKANLDLDGLEGQLAKARGMIRSLQGQIDASLAAAGGGRTPASRGGVVSAAVSEASSVLAAAAAAGAEALPAPDVSGIARAASGYGAAAEAANDIVKEITSINAEGERVIRTTRAIGKGLLEVTNDQDAASQLIDTSGVAALKSDMGEISRRYAPQLAGAMGDTAAQIGLARQRVAEMDQVLARNSALGFSEAFEKAQGEIGKARKELAALESKGRRESQNRFTKQSKDTLARAIDDQINRARVDAAALGGDLTARAAQSRELARSLQDISLAAESQGFDAEAKRARNAAASALASARRDRQSVFDSLAAEEAKARSSAAKAALKKTEEDFRRSIGDEIRQSELRIAQLGKDYAGRAGEFQRRAKALDQLESRGRAQGFVGAADSARAARLQAETKAMRELNRTVVQSGHNFDFHSSSVLRNAASFAKWNAAMLLVTAPLAAITAGVRGAIRIQRESAVLLQVFQGTEAEAIGLRDATLGLAAANGRASSEANDAAVSYARLALSQSQAILAVETSLKAANVAEIDAGRATEDLSAIYAAFSLSVSELPAVLGRLNSISNRYNATVDDQLQGLSRVSGVARQAGIDLARLEGVIAAATGLTGRGGAEIGNALKTIAQELTDIQKAERLQRDFGIAITDNSGALLRFDTILRNVVLRYDDLSTAQQSQLRQLVAGSRQAARFANIIDSYGTALALSAVAQTDLNSANQENERIISTADAQIQAVATAWEALWTTILTTRVGDYSALDALALSLEAAVIVFTQAADAANLYLQILGKFTQFSPAGFTESGLETLKEFRPFRDAAAFFGGGKTGEEINSLRSEGRRAGKALGEELTAANREALKRLHKLDFADLIEGGSGGSNPIADFIGRTFRDLRRGGNALAGAQANAFADLVGAGSAGEAAASADELREALEANNEELVRLKNNAGAAGAAGDFFEYLADRARSAGDSAKFLREFEKQLRQIRTDAGLVAGSDLLPSAEIEGLIRNARALAQGGDLAGAAAQLDVISQKISESAGAADKAFRDAYEPSLEAADAAVDAINAQQAALRDAGQAGTREYENLEAAARNYIKAAEDLRRLEGEAPAPENPLGAVQLQVDRFAELSARRLQGILSAAQGGPNFSSAADKARLSILALREAMGSIDFQRASNDFRLAEERLGGVAAAEYDRAAAAFAAENAKLGEARDEIEKKLEEAQAGLSGDILSDVFAAAGRGVENAVLAFDAGANAGDRMLNRARALRDLIDQNGATDLDWARSDSLDRESTRNAGIAAARQLQIDVAREQATVEQSRLQTMYDQRRALEDQRREMEELLGLASREDQVRAAAASAAARRGTDFGSADFQRNAFPFFSDELRRAISQLSPDFAAARRGRDSAREGADLDAAARALSETAALLRPLAALEPALREAFGERGPDAREALTPGARVGEIIQLSIGDVRINLDVSEEIRGAVDVKLDAIRAEFQGDLNRWRESIDRQLRGDGDYAAGSPV